MDTNDKIKSGASSEAPPPKLHSPATPPRRHVWPWVLAGVVVLLIATVILLRRNQPKAEAARGGSGRAGAGQQTVMIDTATAKKGDIGVYLSALGTVTPYYTVSNRTRVDGQIMKVLYNEGQLVHEGDPLVEIDSAPFEASLLEAQGQLARDQALLENARLDLDRYKEAYSKNAIPKQQLDTQLATVHQDEGIVQLDQGQLTNAQVQLAYTHINAPITGRVGLRLVDPGNIVHASDTSPIVVITKLQPITVIFNVAEDYLPQIHQQLRQGKKLTVDALDRAQQKKIATGVLDSLDNQIDTTTGTLRLKAIFTNEDESLFPNQFVNARLLVDTHHDVILLPNAVIQHNAQGAYVYLIKPDRTVTIKSVNVVVTEGDYSEIEGLDVGDVVAASNFNRLTDGAKVTIRAPGEGKQRNGASTNSPMEKGSNSPTGKGKKRTNDTE